MHGRGGESRDFLLALTAGFWYNEGSKWGYAWFAGRYGFSERGQKDSGTDRRARVQFRPFDDAQGRLCWVRHKRLTVIGKGLMMRSKTACVSVLVRFVIFSIAVCGCTEVQTGNLSSVAVSHENLPLEDIQVFNLDCSQADDELVVSGRIRRSCNFCRDDVRGHVDIVLLDAEGAVLGAASAFYHPRSIPKGGLRYSSFSTRLKMTLPEGAVIRTAYHEYPESSDGTKTFQCQNNRAAPQTATEGVVQGAQ
jgi:hypothetical protein